MSLPSNPDTAPVNQLSTPDFDRALFAVLNQIRERLGSDDLFEKATPPWHRNKKACRMEIDKLIATAEREIRVVSYSFTTYQNEHETQIIRFLKRGGIFRVLMVDPESPGFLEKTALEAFVQEDATDFDAWQRITAAKRLEHKTDIVGSLAHMLGWRDRFPNHVEFRFYADTPNMSGMLFDDSGMFFSSYFIDPSSRGFESPAVIARNVKDNLNLEALRLVLWNWFEVKFATGRNPLS